MQRPPIGLWRRHNLLLLCLLLLTACVRPPQLPPPALAPGMQLIAIADSDPGTPFAVDPTGRYLALARDGVQLLTFAAKSSRRLATDAPLALAWDRSGARLAAAFPAQNGSRVELFDLDANDTAVSTDLAGRIVSLSWRNATTLTVTTVTISDYRFGSSVNSALYRWTPPQPPQEIYRYGTTLKPGTRAALGAAVFADSRHVGSPAGDEVLFSELHDPPAVAPYRTLTLRHLDGGARTVAQLPLTGAAAGFGPDETVVYGDGSGKTVQLDPWTDSVRRSWPAPGRQLALSADGRYLFADGRLFDGEREIATLPGAEAAVFTPQGLLLRRGAGLWLLQGLALPPAPAAQHPDPQLVRLRAWRSRGLIDHDEYLQQKESHE